MLDLFLLPSQPPPSLDVLSLLFLLALSANVNVNGHVNDYGYESRDHVEESEDCLELDRVLPMLVELEQFEVSWRLECLRFRVDCLQTWQPLLLKMGERAWRA